MSHRICSLLTLSLLFSLQPLFAQQLTHGQAAPPLTSEHWVLGEALTKFEEGTIYIVEFWGEDPNMGFTRRKDFTALQEKHGDKLKIVGVMQDSEDFEFEGVADYYKEHAKDLTCHIAWDVGGKLHKAWVTAADENTPSLFLVDGTGSIAWIGDLGFLEIVLPKVLAGKVDSKALAEESKGAMKQFTGVLLVAGMNPAKAIEVMDRLLKKYPWMDSMVVPTVYNTLLEIDSEDEYASKGIEVAMQLRPRLCDVCIASKDTDWLNGLAWSIVDPELKLEERDLVIAEKAATKAVEFTQEKDAAILDTLARVFYWKKDYKQAIAWQKKAVALSEAGNGLEEMTATLKEYEKLVSEQ